MPKIPGNPFGAVRSSNQLQITTTTALPKIIVPNLPIHINSPSFSNSQPTVNPIHQAKSSPKPTNSPSFNSDDQFNSINKKIITTTQSSIQSTSSADSNKNPLESNRKENANQFKEILNPFDSSMINGSHFLHAGNYNDLRNEIHDTNNDKNEQTPASSSPFVKPESKQLNTESSINNQQSNDLNDSNLQRSNPNLIRRSMLNNNQNAALSIFLNISIILSTGILCLTLVIFMFSRLVFNFFSLLFSILRVLWPSFF